MGHKSQNHENVHKVKRSNISNTWFPHGGYFFPKLDSPILIFYFFKFRQQQIFNIRITDGQKSNFLIIFLDTLLEIIIQKRLVEWVLFDYYKINWHDHATIGKSGLHFSVWNKSFFCQKRVLSFVLTPDSVIEFWCFSEEALVP